MSAPEGPNTALQAMQSNLAQSAGAAAGPTLNGGRIFGFLPPDTAGFLGGTQGFIGGPILNGGMAGIGSSAQRAPGMLARLLVDLRNDLMNMAKNDPGPSAIMGTASDNGGGASSGGGGGGGATDFASMAETIGLPPGVTGGIQSVIPDSGLARPTVSSAHSVGHDEGYGIG